jgi:hypothetical protein
MLLAKHRRSLSPFALFFVFSGEPSRGRGYPAGVCDHPLLAVMGILSPEIIPQYSSLSFARLAAEIFPRS